MRDGDRVIRVERFRPETQAGVGTVGQQVGFGDGEIAVVGEDEYRVGRRVVVDDRGAPLVEMEERAVEGVERRLESPTTDGDAGTRRNRLMTDGVLPTVECAPNQGGGAPLVGVQTAEVAPVERDGELVGEDEVDPHVLADGVREEEGGRNAPTEHVEATGDAREVVEREVGGRRSVVTDDDELAHGCSVRASALGYSIRIVAAASRGESRIVDEELGPERVLPGADGDPRVGSDADALAPDDLERHSFTAGEADYTGIVEEGVDRRSAVDAVDRPYHGTGAAVRRRSGRGRGRRLRTVACRRTGSSGA